MPAPTFRWYSGDERLDRTSIPVDDAQQLKAGWFVNEESGEAVPHNANTEDDIFAGCVLTGHEPGKDYRSEVAVAEKAVLEVDVVSADYVRGEGLKINGTAPGDDIELTKDGGTNTMCHADETKASATRLLVRIDVWALQKLRGATT